MRTGAGEYSKNPWEIFYANRDGSNGMPAKETVIQGDYEIIATLHGNKSLQNANANLMAAAPDLLAACKLALEYIDEYCPELGGSLTETIHRAILKYELPEEVLEMTDASVISALRACVDAKDELIELYAADAVRIAQAVQQLISAHYAGEDMEPFISAALKMINGR